MRLNQKIALKFFFLTLGLYFLIFLNEYILEGALLTSVGAFIPLCKSNSENRSMNFFVYVPVFLIIIFSLGGILILGVERRLLVYTGVFAIWVFTISHVLKLKLQNTK